MSLAFLLLTMGLVCLVAGGALALNVRGCAHALERKAAGNAELAMHARGELGQPQLIMSARLYRCLGTVFVLCGIVLTPYGFLELA
ncbi:MULTISPECIES: hypothetical protein [unclassified Streptomyces]|uniref:hypothetical protein n=1 Tax=unclassified Streptomyces TaxID=2593676 RepID=UPI002E2B6A69|nr:hypothetical protein [Streptomyces sp. NBC_00272]